MTRPSGAAQRGSDQSQSDDAAAAANGAKELARVLEQLRAQSRAIDERVRALEETIARQNQEIARLRAQRASVPARPQPGAAADQGAAGAEGTEGTEGAEDTGGNPEPALNTDPAPDSTTSTDGGSQPAPAAPTASAPSHPADPFASPTEFVLELRTRFAERFGSEPRTQPLAVADHDDDAMTLKRWTVGQNRILCQPVEWRVRVLRVVPAPGSPARCVLTCVAAEKPSDGLEHMFEVDLVEEEAVAVRSMPAGATCTLVGIMDPRLSFSPEHERNDRWDRPGTVIGPNCVSNWRVQGLQVRGADAAPSDEAAAAE